MKFTHIITAFFLSGLISACSSLQPISNNEPEQKAEVDNYKVVSSADTTLKSVDETVESTISKQKTDSVIKTENSNLSHADTAEKSTQQAVGSDTVSPQEPGINLNKPGSQANNAIPLENAYPFQPVKPRFSVVEENKEPETQPEVKEDKLLFEKVIEQFELSIPEHPKIAKHRKFYLDNLEYVERVLERSRPYLYFILEEIEKRNLPTELALLPAIESAFLTSATSKSNAAGLWQFIPATGRYFGLKQNWWSDQRRDVILSTQSALDYLKELNIEFNGDWYLAIAAYNGGQGTVGNAIKKNAKQGKPTDYFSLKLSQETMNYVPKLLAFVDIVKHAHVYNLKIPQIPNFPYFTLIETSGQIDMPALLDKTTVNEDIFYQLNAGFKRWASSPEGPHRVVVPVESSQNVKQYLENQPKTADIRWRSHKLTRGDTLYGLAKQYKVSINAIKTINKMKSNLLREGKTILIPLRSA